MSDLNYIDYTIIAIIGISTFVAYFRGLITEVMSFLVWAVAFWGAIVYYENVAKILPNLLGNYSSAAINTNMQNFSDPSGEGMIITALSFIITFLAILFMAGLFNLFVSLLIRRLKIAWPDRLFGMFFGFLRGALAVLIAGVFIINSDLAELDYWKNAKLAPTVTSGVQSFSKLIPEKFLAQINTKNIVARMKDAATPEATKQGSIKPAIPTNEAPTNSEFIEPMDVPAGLTDDDQQQIEFIEHID